MKYIILTMSRDRYFPREIKVISNQLPTDSTKLISSHKSTIEAIRALSALNG